MTIKELHDNLYDEKPLRNPRFFIDTYEKNIDLINNVDISNLIDYDYAMRLTCDYAILLEDSGYIKKSIQYLDKAIDLMENFPNFQKDKLFDIHYYELIVFHKAHALYNLKKYKDSLLIFERLDKAFPNNDKYLGWIYGIKSKKYELYSNVGLGLILADLILGIFFKGKNHQFDIFLLWVLIFALIFLISSDILKRIQLRGKKLTPHKMG
jgi:tetratricopeptide (TPR) repeat protein